MFKSKKKGLFVDRSEFSFLAARTSSEKAPFTLEAIGELPRDSDLSGPDLFEQLYDFGGVRYAPAVCGVYPPSRFLHLFEAETAAKAKDAKYLETHLRDRFKVEPESSSVDILQASNGQRFDLKVGGEKRLIFCGAPQSEFLEAQSALVERSVYPSRMEMGTVASIGGLLDYVQMVRIKGPVLFFELRHQGAAIFILNRGGIDDIRSINSGLSSIFPLLQNELGLRDQSSAERIFFSNTFDFAEMGPKLLRDVIRELQASIGSYEVRTGQMIEHLFVSLLPKNLSWISRTLSTTLGVQHLRADYIPWLESHGVTIGDSVDLSTLGSRWLGLFSLMLEFRERTIVDEPETTTEREQSEEQRDTATVAN